MKEIQKDTLEISTITFQFPVLPIYSHFYCFMLNFKAQKNAFKSKKKKKTKIILEIYFMNKEKYKNNLLKAFRKLLFLEPFIPHLPNIHRHYRF